MTDEQSDKFHTDDATLDTAQGSTEIDQQQTLDATNLPRESGQVIAEPLARMLDTLTDSQRLAIRLRHLERWPLEAIANRMGKTPAEIARFLRTGMESLREQLPVEDEE